MDISKQDFHIIRDYIHKICGIYLKDDKDYIISQRFSEFLPMLSCSNFAELAWKTMHAPDARMNELFIEAATTNETSFFRDRAPFLVFRDYILPNICNSIVKRRSQSGGASAKPASYILSAGCSTGQEAYSAAISIDEFLKASRVRNIAYDDFSIIGADISKSVLAAATKGEYSDMEINRGMNKLTLSVHFDQTPKGWKVKDEIKRIVKFYHSNFCSDSFIFGKFDLIFCRNILIYFDAATRKNILTRLHSLLNEGGYLIVGSTESVFDLQEFYEPIHVSGAIIYKKK
jgi:chemotaxis protein methyltransferase CheR